MGRKGGGAPKESSVRPGNCAGKRGEFSKAPGLDGSGLALEPVPGFRAERRRDDLPTSVLVMHIKPCVPTRRGEQVTVALEVPGSPRNDSESRRKPRVCVTGPINEFQRVQLLRWTCL